MTTLPETTLAHLRHLAAAGQYDAQALLHLLARADKRDKDIAEFTDHYAKTIAALCRRLGALERGANDLPDGRVDEARTRAVLTSDDIPPGSLSEDDLRRRWNEQADEYNQWESLGSCEQLAWAQALAIMADRARATLKAEPEGEGPSLQWTDNMPPSEACRYDHCIAETPFGRFLITWKSWEEYDSPTVDETPWGDWYAAFNSVDDAKAACQQGMNERLTRCGTPATPPAPEPGEVGELSLLQPPCNPKP
jgi:hypothetical protein